MTNHGTLRIARLFRVAVLASWLGPATASADPILINGSFELTTPDMPANGELLAGSTAILGWTVAGTSTANDVIDWLGPGGGGPEWLASDGTHIVELDGRNSLNGAIYQTFGTIPGQRYDVSFDLSGNPGDAPSNRERALAPSAFLTPAFWRPLAFSPREK